MCEKALYSREATKTLTDSPQLVPGGLKAGGELAEHLRANHQPAGPPPPPPSLISHRAKMLNRFNPRNAKLSPRERKKRKAEQRKGADY